MVLLPCFYGIVVVLLWCCCGVAAVSLWCCCGVAVVLLWCSCVYLPPFESLQLHDSTTQFFEVVGKVPKEGIT
jgi:hypothetical protein